MDEYPFNRRLKLIAAALDLQSQDVAQAITLGGIETSRNRAGEMMRSPGARKYSGGNGKDGGRSVSRFKAMSEAEFDAFCVGLKPVVLSLDET